MYACTCMYVCMYVCTEVLAFLVTEGDLIVTRSDYQTPEVTKTSKPKVWFLSGLDNANQ